MKTISVHSYKGGTGKTTFLLNLAGVLNTKANNILAVDYDLRAPSFQSYFKLRGNNFVSDYLLDQKKLDAVITPTNIGKEGNFDLIFSSMEFLKQHSKERDKLSRDDSKYLSKMYELQQYSSKAYQYLLLDTIPGFFFRSIDSMMISDVILTIATPSTSNVLGLEELCSNIYELLKDETKMILVINMIGKEGIEADKTIVEENLDKLRKIGKEFYGGTFFEIPHYGMMGERIHSFEDNPNEEFIKKIEDIISVFSD